jgi:starch synthase
MPDAPHPLKILFVSAEAAPFAKTGGLGDVVGAVPKALRLRGIDVRVVMPLYSGIDWDSLERLEGSLLVPMWWGTVRAAVRLGRLPRSDVPVYFLEYHRYFDRPHLYGPPGEAYGDNLERFTLLSRGALELAKAIGFVPDVIHAHDWQTALVPVYVDTVEWARPLHGAATVYTIHNLAYQRVTDGDALFVTALGPEHYNAREFEHFGTLNLSWDGGPRHTSASTGALTGAAVGMSSLTAEKACQRTHVARAPTHRTPRARSPAHAICEPSPTMGAPWSRRCAAPPSGPRRGRRRAPRSRVSPSRGAS